MILDFPKTKKLRIFTVEDDFDFAYLIQTTLNREKDMTVVGHAASEKEALFKLSSLPVDLVLMDLNLSSSPSDGILAGRHIRLKTDAKLVILTAYEEPATIIEACKQSFASGYIFKSHFEALPENLRRMATGATPQLALIRSLILSDLSAAEQSVLNLMLGAKITLRSSSKTISNQKNSILRKLGLRNQEELIHLFRHYLL
ncbi:MAG: response regulator transcription factor [Lachnospiraceae bacterium]|nr:response regulator transcription factor [Lachnospiraceae bacterium]